MSIVEAESTTDTNAPVVFRAWSKSRNPMRMMEELKRGLTPCDPALIALFVSSNLPYEDVVTPLATAFPQAVLVGCTTAGSLTSSAYEGDEAIAVAFDPPPSPSISASCRTWQTSP